jgi:hypothetical protein
MTLKWVAQRLNMAPPVPWRTCCAARTSNANMEICDYEEPTPSCANAPLGIIMVEDQREPYDVAAAERKTLRGIIAHEPGCGPGDDRAEPAAAGDLLWQALARKHDCALLAPTYEQSDRELS